MMNFILKTILLLCSLCWISVSVSEFNAVDVQSGEQVTLLCSNFTSSPTQIMWFRVIRRLKPHCISSIFKASEPASFCEGFENGKVEATANMSTIFLTIKQVDLSDSGFYFCGSYLNNYLVIVSATYIDVQDMFDVTVKLMSVILGGLVVFLTSVIIGLIVKNKKLQAQREEQNPQQTESHGSDDLNYAVVTFCPNTEGNLRCASES